MSTERKKPGEDRISAIPGDVLCHILSFLPIKEAMATSLLSRSWRFLWTTVPSLHIDCSKPIMEYYQRVNIFLGLFRTEKITRFHLTCNNRHDCCSRYVEEWIYAVVARKVEHVNICLCQRSVFRFNTLFTCTTLVTLNLEGPFCIYIPSSVHLPNVKTLHLHVKSVGILFFPNIKKLISGSPVLKLFHIHMKQKECHRLKIVRKSQVIQLFQCIGLYNLVIQSDRAYDFIPDYLEDRWRNLVNVKVCITLYDVYDYKHSRLNSCVPWILKGLRNVEFLSLGDFMVDMDSSTVDLPVFQNLVELRLFLRDADSLFMKLLPAKCPKLEVLEVNVLDDRYGINQRCRYRVSGGVRERDLSIVPFLPKTTIVGKCLGNSLACC